MTILAPERHIRAAGSEDNVAFGIQDLPSGVLLTGTPTVAEQTTSDLTLTSAAVNTAELTLFGETFAIGTAVVFHRAGGVAGTEYTIRVTVSTDASPADVIVGDLILEIVA